MSESWPTWPRSSRSATCLQGRSRRSRWSARRTRSTARSGPRTWPRSCCATTTARAGMMAVSQISAGHKNSLQYEIDGSAGAAAWDSEQPDELWLGHRGRPNESLARDAALMTPAGRAAAALPAGHVEGFADTFAALFRAVYADVAAGRMRAEPAVRDVRRRPRGDARRRRDRAERTGAALGRGRARHGPTDQPRPGGGAMRLGFLTAPFPETPLMDVADWAAANEFESLEIACWPQSGGVARRYAGTSHIDVANLQRPTGPGDPRRDRRQGPGDQRPRLLPQPAPPGSSRPRSGHRPHQARHRGVPKDGRAVHEHVHGRRFEEEPGRELG